MTLAEEFLAQLRRKWHTDLPLREPGSRAVDRSEIQGFALGLVAAASFLARHNTLPEPASTTHNPAWPDTMCSARGGRLDVGR
jgi:hypothetical protein